MVTAATSSLINNLRQKMAQGLEVSDDEMVEAVRLLRADRFSAATASATKSTARASKAAVLNVNGDDLLGEMMS